MIALAASEVVQNPLDRLDGVKRNGSGWTAKCPAHDDRRASLSIGTGDDGRVLLCCHAGCSTNSVLAAIGLGVSIVGQVGDLAESLLKRWAGVKDSGNLIPGHGGLLDRMDSIVFAGPFMYYCIRLLDSHIVVP